MMGCVPRTGIHAIRLFDFAIVDIIMSLAAAALISYVVKIRLWISVLLVLLAAIITHRVLRINTKLNVILFGEL